MSAYAVGTDIYVVALFLFVVYEWIKTIRYLLWLAVRDDEEHAHG